MSYEAAEADGPMNIPIIKSPTGEEMVVMCKADDDAMAAARGVPANRLAAR